MQTEFIEKWTELCKCAAKPLTEIAELNVNTLNEWTKNVKFNEFTQIKKPEDVLAMHTKIANEVIKSAGVYAEKVGEIYRDAAAHTSKIMNEILHETISKASSSAEIFKHAAKGKADNVRTDKNRE